MLVPPLRPTSGPLRSFAARIAVIVAIGCAGALWLVTTPHDSIGQQLRFRNRNLAGTDNPENDFYGVYLPTDRTLSRGMARARERIANGEYQEALAFLQQVLEREEDKFIDDSSNAEAHLGLKATARQMIAELPPQGREMYRLLHAASAQRQLETAISDGDREALTKLVRQFLLTPAGFEAALLLAQMELDRGHPLAAAYLYEQLRHDRQSAAQFEPQLSLLAAVSWASTGQTDRVAAALRDAAGNHPGATIQISGRDRNLPSSHASDAELVAWLADLVGRPQPNNAASQDWQTQRGDSQRNADHGGGAPHVRARWQSRVVGDPRAETFLSSRRRQLQQHGVVALPAARPIAVGNVVLMRTPRNVVAVDLETGKRIWETREEETNGWDQSLAEFASTDDREEPLTTRHPLEQRMWDDLLTMSLSSDGQRVFVLSETTPSPQQANLVWGMNPAFQGPGDTNLAPTNRLSAYELTTEGKLAWEIDGATGPADLAGAFFLGPPLAVSGALYVLAEVRSAVYLLALDPSSGRLIWRQQLAGLEQSIVLDPQRRLQSATPSYSAGILICPTGSGMVAAVDVVRREFAWVYRYPRRIDSTVQFQQAWRARSENLLVREDRGWLDGAVVVADGRVFLTPPESAELHCLDLHSGKQLWKQQRDQADFLACVDGGNVLLVGSQSVTAIRAADRTPAWPDERVDLPSGMMPAGLGYLSRGRYFLPLTSGQVVAIDLSDGSMGGLADAATDAALGNLICHRGAILSQSALFLDKYEQIDVLRKRAESALAHNPRDAAAIRDLAEMQRADGELAKAIQMLEQAFAIAPDDLLTRNMLADILLEALAADFGRYRDQLPFIRQLIDDPQQQVSLLRIEAQGLQSAGEVFEAFVAYLRLADAVQFEPQLLSVGEHQTARSDCWVRGHLNALWAEAASDQRGEISRRLEKRWRAWEDRPTIVQLRRYLAFFGGLPGSDEASLQLARQLVARGESLEAEMELLKLQQSSDPNYQAAAGVLMTNWLLANNRLGEARRIAASLADRWPDGTVLDGMTGRQWLAAMASDLSTEQDLTSNNWPRGQVTVELSSATSPRRRSTQRAGVEFQLGLQRLRVEQFDRHGLGPSQWLIAQDGSRIVGRNGLGKDVFRFSADQGMAMRRFIGKSDWIQAAQLGDVLYITFGGQIIALDSRRRSENGEADVGQRPVAVGDGSVLWRAYPAGRFPAVPPNYRRRGSQSVYHPWSERRRMSNPTRLLLGSLGPASPHGVVIQEQDVLRRVDPMSGETLWSRSDIPPGCELFGDDALLLAADGDGSTIYVINMIDGGLVDRRDFPTSSWMLTAGRSVARLSDTRSDRGVRKSLSIVDVATGQSLFSADYAPSARMTTIEPNSIAIVEPPDYILLAQHVALAAMGVPIDASVQAGRFQLIDVRTGQLRIDRSLPVPANLKGIEVLQSQDQLFLMLDGQSRPTNSRYIGVDYPLIDGLVYAFDLRTLDMMWPRAAVVERRGIALMQPIDIPLLVFVDRETTRDTSDRRTQLRLLCLDKRTGSTIYRDDALPDTPSGQFYIRATRSKQPSVAIEMSARTIRLAYSDQPRSPEPPANDRIEAARTRSGGGLLSVGQRMGEAIQGAIQNPRGTGRDRPGPKPNRDGNNDTGEASSDND